MYLHVPDALGQPQKEPSREELQEELLLCRRDALLAERPHQECEQTLERTERVLQEAMADLAKCRKEARTGGNETAVVEMKSSRP